MIQSFIRVIMPFNTPRIDRKVLELIEMNRDVKFVGLRAKMYAFQIKVGVEKTKCAVSSKGNGHPPIPHLLNLNEIFALWTFSTPSRVSYKI